MPPATRRKAQNGAVAPQDGSEDTRPQSRSRPARSKRAAADVDTEASERPAKRTKTVVQDPRSTPTTDVESSADAEDDAADTESSSEDETQPEPVPSQVKQKITKVKSRTARKANVSSRRSRPAVTERATEQSSNDEEEEEPTNTRQPSLKKSFDHLLDPPIEEVDLVEEYLDSLDYVDIGAPGLGLSGNSAMPQSFQDCSIRVREYWAEVKDAGLHKQLTVLEDRLALREIWALTMHTIEESASAEADSHSRLIHYLQLFHERLSLFQRQCGRRQKWRNQKELVQDFFTIIYPSLVVLVPTLLAAFEQVWTDRDTDKQELACKAMQEIRKVIFTTLELEATTFKLKDIYSSDFDFRGSIRAYTRKLLAEAKSILNNEQRERDSVLQNSRHQLPTSSYPARPETPESMLSFTPPPTTTTTATPKTPQPDSNLLPQWRTWPRHLASDKAHQQRSIAHRPALYNDFHRILSLADADETAEQLLERCTRSRFARHALDMCRDEVEHELRLFVKRAEVRHWSNRDAFRAGEWFWTLTDHEWWLQPPYCGDD